MANTGELIEADSSDGLTDTDSTFGSGSASYTTSLSPSVMDYQYENGRRYHKYREGQYIFPNDETENNRLDLQHHIFLLRMDGHLLLSPIGSNPHKILDLGTGTGIWAIDIADEYPSAEVIGTDLSPIQPTLVPPNCHFEVDDMEADWAYAKNSFDLIHMRQLSGSIKDWPRLFDQAYDHIKPGGYIESHEIHAVPDSDDGTLLEDSGMLRSNRIICEAANKLGRPMAIGDKMKGYMEKAGFVDVREIMLKIPCGPWPRDKKLKELGVYQQLNMLEGVEGFLLALLTRVLGWQQEEVKVLAAQVRADLNDRSIHSYFRTYIVYGRKPEEP